MGGKFQDYNILTIIYPVCKLSIVMLVWVLEDDRHEPNQPVRYL